MPVGEILRTFMVLPFVELGRLGLGLQRAVGTARKLGMRMRRRSEDERVHLRRAVSLVDRMVPWGPNCYRRVLLEIALDAGAAGEPVMLGFRANGGTGSGHAWLPYEQQAQRYDAVISV